jgi:hypothetical protein
VYRINSSFVQRLVLLPRCNSFFKKCTRPMGHPRRSSKRQHANNAASHFVKNSHPIRIRVLPPRRSACHIPALALHKEENRTHYSARTVRLHYNATEFAFKYTCYAKDCDHGRHSSTLELRRRLLDYDTLTQLSTPRNQHSTHPTPQVPPPNGELLSKTRG